MGVGMCTHGLCGYQNPCGFGPQVPCESTWQRGDNPPHCVNSCFSTWQGGRNPLHHFNLSFSMRQGGRNIPATLIRVCVVGVSKGMGEQLGRGGRELELHHNVFNLKTNLSWEWAQWPTPTLVAELCLCLALSIPSPPSHLCVVMFWGSCPRHVVASVIVWRWGRVVVDVK